MHVDLMSQRIMTFNHKLTLEIIFDFSLLYSFIGRCVSHKVKIDNSVNVKICDSIQIKETECISPLIVQRGKKKKIPLLPYKTIRNIFNAELLQFWKSTFCLITTVCNLKEFSVYIIFHGFLLTGLSIKCFFFHFE